VPILLTIKTGLVFLALIGQFPDPFVHIRSPFQVLLG
jgi:hypothetical protein